LEKVAAAATVGSTRNALAGRQSGRPPGFRPRDICSCVVPTSHC